MPEENKAVMQRFFDQVLNQKHLAVFDEIVSPDVVAHHIPPGMPPGFDGWKGMVSMVLSALDNPQVTAEDMMAEGDKVATRFVFRGTHSGDLMGIPPSGKDVDFSGAIMERFANGKVVEHWEVFDVMTLMQQIGAVPS